MRPGETQADDLLAEFLGDTPRAAEWRSLRKALRERLNALLESREREVDAATHSALEVQITALRKQVAALETEEVVAQFVEDSVKASLARAPLFSDEEEE